MDIMKENVTRIVNLWDIFFVGQNKALVCIPPQKYESDVQVKNADIEMDGYCAVIKRNDGLTLLLELPEMIGNQFKKCKMFMIAESPGIQGITTSYEGTWVTNSIPNI